MMRVMSSEGVRPLPPPSYGKLLEVAYQLGRADGLRAGDLDLPEDPEELSYRFRGRDSSEFADWLWGAHRGRAPAGLTVNAGHWYIQGFRDGLAMFREPASARFRPADEGGRADRLPSSHAAPAHREPAPRRP